MAGDYHDIAMSRTKRRYNNPNKKAFWVILGRYRYTEMDFKTGARNEHVPDEEDYNRLKHAVLCMGNCPWRKDKKRDQMKRMRKQFLFRLAMLDGE